MNRKIILKISGMYCASCVANIELDLAKMPGVKSISVNLANEKAYLEFDERIVSLEKIQNRIEKLGYKAVKEDRGMEGHHNEGETGNLKRRFILALMFGSPIIYMAMGGMIGLPIPEILEITEF